MIEKKIITAKNILRVIISILVIFSMLKSCAKAWTFDQFLEYCEQIKVSDESTQLMKRAADLVITRKNKLIDAGIRNYSSFNLNYNTTGWVQLLAGTGTYTINSANSSKITWTPSSGWHEFRIDHNIIMVVDGGSTSSSSLIAADRLGLIEFTNEGLIPSNFWLQNKYGMPMDFVTVRNAVINYKSYQNVNAINVNYNNIWQPLGYLYALNSNNDYYTFVWLDSNGAEISRLEWNTSIEENYQQGNLYFTPQSKNIYVSTRLLYKENIYTLAVYSSNIDNTITNSNDSQVFTYVAMNYNTTYSGDNILSIGSGDGYTDQNSANDQISWWEDTINGMFTMDENDLNEIRAQFSGEIASKVPISAELNLFNDMTEMQPTDFVISWPPVTYTGTEKLANGTIRTYNKIIIPSGDINFSQKVRENPVANQIHTYAQIIVSAALTWLLLNEIWRTFVITAGVGMELYNDYTNENEIVETQSATINANTGEYTTTVRQRRGNKTIAVNKRGNIRK